MFSSLFNESVLLNACTRFLGFGGFG
jgi:hypothetical protein